MASRRKEYLNSKYYRWLDKKPLSETVSWTCKEKFWLISAIHHYGAQDWKSIAQVLKNVGEPHRPRDWYSSKNCERQFKMIISNFKKEIKIKPFNNVMEHVVEVMKIKYIRELQETNENLVNKVNGMCKVLNRIKQGNLSRSEAISLYSNARRTEVEGKQYVEQLLIRQTTWLASEISSSGLSEEPIKWNAPSAPLLTSLLRSRSTISVSRTVTAITATATTSILHPVGGTSRTRSGKLLSTSPTVRTPTQGTPTLSKLLEAPANPYIPSPQQASQKNKLNDIVGTDKLIGNTSRKENSPSTSLNKVRMDNTSNSGSFNQTNRIDLSASKRQTPKSVGSAVKNGSKANSNIVNLLSDSDNEEGDKSLVHQSLQPKHLFEEKNDNITINASNCKRIETRATRSQTRAEGGFKHLNDTKLSGGKKDHETLRQHSGETQITETHSIDDELIDIDQIEVEPLSSVQDETINHTPSKITRSSVQRLKLNSPAENILPIKMKNKEINNQMLEEISANFVLNSSIKNVATEYKNVMVGQSRIDNGSLSGCLVPVDASTVKDGILLRKDGQSFPHPANTLTTFDGKVIKQKRLIEIKGANLRCIDSRSDAKYLAFSNQPIVVVNKIKKPFNIKLASSEAKDNIDDIQITNSEIKKTVKLRNSSQNLNPLIENNCSHTDEVIIIDDDVNINVDENTKNKDESPCNSESQNLCSTVAGTNDSGSNISGNSKSVGFQLNSKTKNDKIPENMLGKNHNILNISSKKSKNHDGIHKIGISSNINDTNSRFIKELDFDFDQSISQTTLTELYNGVEEIVEMHSFDNEELNSLIECGSLNINVTEECQNVTNLDQGDSSVSVSDSTIGAFDTFAQITRVSQNSSKEDKSINKDSKTIKQVSKDLESDEGITQSADVDGQSTATSVTAIPILQGVISDVMSKIVSDRDAPCKVVDSLNESTDEVVEISSDEEELSHIKKQFPSTAIEIENPVKKITMHKLNEEETNKINLLETNSVLINKNKNISREIKETPLNSSEIKNIKSHISNMLKKPTAKNVSNAESVLSITGLESKGTKKKHIALENEINISSEETGNENTFKEPEVKNLKLEIAEERLRCRKDLKIKKAIDEKRLKEIFDKKIEEENKIKDDEEKKKKENDERKKREEEERKKKEEEVRKEEHERKRKEEERKRIEEERKRIEEERKRIEEERKRKEEEEKNIKKEEEKKRIEEERKRKEEEETRKKYEEIKLTAANIKQEKFDEIDEMNEEILQKAINSVEMNFEEQYGHNSGGIVVKDEFEVEIMQRAKKRQLKRAKITELIKARNIKMKKAKAKELEIAKLKENELIIKAREAEVIRAKEHARQNEHRRINEINLQKAIDEEIEKEKQQALTAEIHRAKIAAIKKEKEAILSKKQVEDRSVLRRDSIKKVDVDLVDNSDLKTIEFGPHERQVTRARKLKKLELKLDNSKEDSININDLNKTEKLVQPMLEKKMEIIASTIKENVTKPAARILTRTRGLKHEEKVKEHNFDSKNVNDENKLNNLDTSTVLNDSCEGLISKAQVDGKTRTRSSSSYKQVDTVPKVTVGMKKSVTGTHSEVSTSSSEIQKCTVGSFLEPKNFRALTIPLVKLNSQNLPILKEKMDSMKQSCIKVVTDELPLSQSDVTNDKEKLFQKSGRKRHVVVQNEEFQSKKSKFQNDARTINVKFAPTKRTRSHDLARKKKEEDILNIKRFANTLLKKSVLRAIMTDIQKKSLYISSCKNQAKELYLEEQMVIKRPLNLKSIRNKINIGLIQSIGDLQRYFLIMSQNNAMVNNTGSIIYCDTIEFQENLKSNMNFYHYAFSTNGGLSEKKNDEDDKNNIDDDDENNTDDDDEDYINVNYNIDDDHFIIEDSENIGLNEINCEETVDCIMKTIDFSTDESSSDSESDSYLSVRKKRRKIDQSYVNTSDSNIDSDDYESDV